MGGDITLVTCVFIALKLVEIVITHLIAFVRGDKELSNATFNHEQVINHINEFRIQCENCKKQCDGCQAKLDEVVEFAHIMINMHDVKDNDGTPMWYFPRSFSNDIHSIKNDSTEVRYSQEQMIKLLDKIATILDMVKQNLNELKAKND
jgi:hypothetical protein